MRGYVETDRLPDTYEVSREVDGSNMYYTNYYVSIYHWERIPGRVGSLFRKEIPDSVGWVMVKSVKFIHWPDLNEVDAVIEQFAKILDLKERYPNGD